MHLGPNCPCKLTHTGLICEESDTLASFPKDFKEICPNYLPEMTTHKIKAVLLQNQKLTMPGKMVEIFPNVESMAMKSVKINDIDRYALNDLNQLNYFELSDSKVDAIPNGLFDVTVRLKTLNLTGTEIGQAR